MGGGAHLAPFRNRLSALEQKKSCDTPSVKKSKDNAVKGRSHWCWRGEAAIPSTRLSEKQRWEISELPQRTGNHLLLGGESKNQNENF